MSSPYKFRGERGLTILPTYRSAEMCGSESDVVLDVHKTEFREVAQLIIGTWITIYPTRRGGLGKTFQITEKWVSSRLQATSRADLVAAKTLASTVAGIIERKENEIVINRVSGNYVGLATPDQIREVGGEQRKVVNKVGVALRGKKK